MEKINFKTLDNVTISANWFSRLDSDKAVILLHMMPETKESWNEFTGKLNDSGFSALAIDLRGHGESVEKNGKKLDYRTFDDVDHQRSSADVEAAMEFLKQQGIKTENIYLIGASIGANLAIDAMGRHKEITKTVALSPGLDYKGITVAYVIKSLADNQEIYILASEDDEYSFESAEKLKNSNPEKIIFKKFKDAGHAMSIFNKYPESADEIINWLKK